MDNIMEVFKRKGEWIYIMKSGALVIDYVIGNEEAREEVWQVVEGKRTESNHVPLEVEQECKTGKKESEGWFCLQLETKNIWKVKLERRSRSRL